MALPTREEALDLLDEYVDDDYQKLHAKMVAACLENYAEKYDEDKDLWYVTGLLHDLDFYEHPDQHPLKAVEWFKKWNYPKELIHAVEAHNWKKSGVKPQSKLASHLIAVDELAGFMYAYSLMRPTGFEGMKPSKVRKKFKDKSFAANVDREEIMYGIEEAGVDFNNHVKLMVDMFLQMNLEK